jgi:osmotically-inducible protein OsmY
MMGDDTVKAHQINVDTAEGVVTLSGTVDSQMAKDRAVQLARATDGVLRVEDKMVLTAPPAATTGADDRPGFVDAAGDTASKAGGVMTDAGITTAVKTKFLADTKVSGFKIDVDTKDGVVTLSGGVHTSAERDHAVKMARDTSGVKSVVDKLRVEP